MKEKSIHGDGGARQERYQRRSLDQQFSSIKKHLFPGAKVLDVGCGPGPITIDAAKIVSPGTVIGVDAVESSLEKARNLLGAISWDQKIGN